MTETLNKANNGNPSGTRRKHDLIPDFLIIGAGKSGTTSLDKYLRQHPEIFIPKVKEPNFFGYETISVSDLNGDPAEIMHYRNSITTIEEYLNLFTAARSGQVKGETSNTYMYHNNAPARIYHYNPDMKLIAVLRQPASRLYSRYLHLARESRLPTDNFGDCLDQNTIWWKRNDLIKEGFYYRNLSPFYRLFPASNIRVYLYEELNERPGDVLTDILAFLGVQTDFLPDFSVRYNQSGIIKNRFLDRIYGQRGIVNKTIRTLLPDAVVDKLKANVSLQRTVNGLRSRNLVKPKIDPQVRQRLTHEVYGDDIRKLQQLIGKDLSAWLQ